MKNIKNLLSSIKLNAVTDAETEQASGDDSLNTAVKEMRARYEKAREESDYALGTAIEFEKKSEQLQDQLDQAHDAMEALLNANSELEDRLERSRPSPKVKEVKINQLAEFLKAGYPTLHFDDESINVAATEFSNLNALIRQLKLLVEDHNHKGVKVAGARGWWEADKHISTGKDNNGRLYFKPHPADRYTHYVRIRMKRTQKKDIASMARFDKYES